MKIGIIVSRTAPHQIRTANALVSGMPPGDSAQIFHSDSDFTGRKDCDAVCLWGWRRGKSFRDLGFNVLVMERAYLADRFTYVSLGWNGLNGRAQWPVNSDPSRWEQQFSHLMQPWRETPGKYALLIGQVPTDTACRNIDMESWLPEMARKLHQRGHDVLFRPHPDAKNVRVRGSMRSVSKELSADLSGASVTVTYNSNSAVESVLAGVPTITLDKGSMAWEVCSHSLEEAVCTPDRTSWAHSLAWRQWLPDEIASGRAWPHVKAALRG